MNPAVFFFQNIRALIRRHRKIIAIASFVMFVSLFVFKTGLGDIVFIGLLFAIAMLSIVPKRKLRELPFELEFSLMSTVLIGVSYGPAFGAVFGVVAAALTEILAAHVDMETFFEIFGMGMVGFVSFFLKDASIFIAGILMTVLFLILTQVLLFFIGDEEEKGRVVVYVSVYMVTNLLLFRFIAPLLLSVHKVI